MTENSPPIGGELHPATVWPSEGFRYEVRRWNAAKRIQSAVVIRA